MENFIVYHLKLSLLAGLMGLLSTSDNRHNRKHIRIDGMYKYGIGNCVIFTMPEKQLPCQETVCTRQLLTEEIAARG